MTSVHKFKPFYEHVTDLSPDFNPPAPGDPAVRLQSEILKD